MILVRRLARPLLASMFLASGWQLFRNPAYGAEAAAKMRRQLSDTFPSLPEDPETLVRAQAAVQLGAGALLATNRVPRLAALALFCTLVPTTLVAHPYWTEKDPGARAEHRSLFLKNLSIGGGLLLAVVDTGGDPSLAWRARHAAKSTARNTRRSTQQALKTSRREAEHMTKAATRTTKAAKRAVRNSAAAVRDKLPV